MFDEGDEPDALAMAVGPSGEGVDLDEEEYVVRASFVKLKKRVATAEAERKVIKERLDSLAQAPQTDGANDKLDREMLSVLSNMGSIVAILAGNKNAEDPMLTAAHCVMQSLITQVHTVYQWSDERKRVVFESMKTQQPFQDALAAMTKPAAS